MLTSFQYRLHQYESDPPAESWEHIRLRLNEEFNSEETALSEKLSAFVHENPVDLWNEISAGLSHEPNPPALDEMPAQYGWPSAEPSFFPLSIPATTRIPEWNNRSVESSVIDTSTRENRPGAAKLISLNWPRVAVAAAIIGVAIAALYYFVDQDRPVRQLTATTNASKKEAGIQPVPAPAEITDQPVRRASPTAMAMGSGLRLFRKRVKNELPVQQASYESENIQPDINYASINGTDRVASAQNIAIPTKPIRDNQGNIIMDEKLVSAPDKNYVTVTGPNGEQTKISKKFLHALSYMNAGSDDENIGIALQESSLWKWLFEEWRQKLLTQPTFIPSSTNFLDIMELKEILHENF